MGNMINRAGTFRAGIAAVGVVEDGPNKLCCAMIRYAIIEEAVNGEWQDIRAEQAEITGWHYLEEKRLDDKKNVVGKDLNPRTIDTLKTALGWPGGDPYWLEDTDLSAVIVQLVLAFESYDGKDRLKVKWLNQDGYQGGGGIEVAKADPATRRAIQTRLGAKLRALSGGTPANAPKPAGAPKAPAPRGAPPPAAKPPAPPTPPAAGCTREDAWQALCAARPSDAEGWWASMLTEAVPGKAEAEFTPEDWAKVREAAKAAADVPY